MANSLRITEMMYAPPGGGDYEYIELKNIGATTLDLSGARFAGGVDFTFSQGTTLAAGAYTTVVSNLTKFRNRYGAGPSVAGVYSGNLSNTGENVTLALPAPYDAAILRFDYSDSWYSNSTTGRSLVVYNENLPAATWDKKASWRPSAAALGSPGSPESAIARTVVINEVLAHQDTGNPGDWIELYNTTADDINIGGWYLSDSGLNLQKFRIPDGTIIPHYGYKTFNEHDDFGKLGDPNAFALSELGDQVHLSTVGYDERVAFGASDRDVTLGRHVTSTGQEEFVPLGAPTMNAANAYPLVGPIVINEIMYNPTLERMEFIELRNLSGADVPLYDPANPANTWQFTEGVSFAFPAGAVMPAYGYALVVGTDEAVFRQAYPDLPPHVQIFGRYTGGLSAAGEALELERPGDPEPPPSTALPYYREDRVFYDNDVPWPAGADGTGASLERKPGTLYGNDPANWQASIVDGGTPGRPNSMVAAPAPASVSIAATDPDAAERGQDPGVFTVTRVGGDLALPLVVYYRLDPSSTASVSDYLPLAGHVVIEASQSTATITVTPVDDSFAEGPETLILVVDPDPYYYSAGTPSGATVTIADSVIDTTPPAVEIADVTPDPRATGVDTISIVFSEPVYGFDLADLSADPQRRERRLDDRDPDDHGQHDLDVGEPRRADRDAGGGNHDQLRPDAHRGGLGDHGRGR